MHLRWFITSVAGKNNFNVLVTIKLVYKLNESLRPPPPRVIYGEFPRRNLDHKVEIIDKNRSMRIRCRILLNFLSVSWKDVTVKT